MEYSIEAILERFEEGLAIIKISPKETLSWPTTKLPKNLKKGARLVIEVRDQASAKLEKDQIAKKLLNEILRAGQYEEKASEND